MAFQAFSNAARFLRLSRAPLGRECSLSLICTFVRILAAGSLAGAGRETDRSRLFFGPGATARAIPRSLIGGMVLATLPRMRSYPRRRSCVLQTRFVVLALLVAMPMHAGAPPQPEPAHRLISLNPSLTAIVLALGAGETLVGVDDYSARQEEAVAGLPRVGGLFDPSLEAVVALAPDRVVLVPSAEQRDFRGQLEALEIPVSTFNNQRFDEVLENIAQLGGLVEKQPQAADRIAAIRRVQAAIASRTRNLPAPRVLIVLQRDPLFIVGADNFVAEMLTTAGAKNIGADFEGPYPRAGMEWLVDAAPEVLIDMDPDPSSADQFWSRWPTLPAVAGSRVFSLDPASVTLPGPWLDRSLLVLVQVLHGPELARQISRETGSVAPSLP